MQQIEEPKKLIAEIGEDEKLGVRPQKSRNSLSSLLLEPLGQLVRHPRVIGHHGALPRSEPHAFHSLCESSGGW